MLLKLPPKTNSYYKCQLSVNSRKFMHSYTFTESVQKLGESIERFNMDSRSGHCDGFQAPFFPINPFPDLGYEEPTRGLLLLWHLIQHAKLTDTIIVH